MITQGQISLEVPPNNWKFKAVIRTAAAEFFAILFLLIGIYFFPLLQYWFLSNHFGLVT